MLPAAVLKPVVELRRRRGRANKIKTEIDSQALVDEPVARRHGEVPCRDQLERIRGLAVNRQEMSGQDFSIMRIQVDTPQKGTRSPEMELSITTQLTSPRDPLVSRRY